MYRIWLKRRQQKGYLSECVCIQFLFTSAATIFLKFSIHRVHRPLALFDVRFFILLRYALDLNWNGV